MHRLLRVNHDHSGHTDHQQLSQFSGIFEPEPTFALVNLIRPAGTVFYPKTLTHNNLG